MFCGSDVDCPRDVFRVFSNPFLLSPRAPITTGIVSVFIPHILVVTIFHWMVEDLASNGKILISNS